MVSQNSIVLNFFDYELVTWLLVGYSVFNLSDGFIFPKKISRTTKAQHNNKKEEVIKKYITIAERHFQLVC